MGICFSTPKKEIVLLNQEVSKLKSEVAYLNHTAINLSNREKETRSLYERMFQRFENYEKHIVHDMLTDRTSETVPTPGVTSNTSTFTLEMGRLAGCTEDIEKDVDTLFKNTEVQNSRINELHNRTHCLEEKLRLEEDSRSDFSIDAFTDKMLQHHNIGYLPNSIESSIYHNIHQLVVEMTKPSKIY